MTHSNPRWQRYFSSFGLVKGEVGGPARQGGWRFMILAVSSNPGHSVILCDFLRHRHKLLVLTLDSFLAGQFFHFSLLLLLRSLAFFSSRAMGGSWDVNCRERSQERTIRTSKQKDSASSPDACLVAVPFFGAFPGFLPRLSARPLFGGRPLASASGREKTRSK